MVRAATVTAVRASISTPVRATGPGRRRDVDGAARLVEGELDVDVGEGNGVAEGDQLGRLLGAHDTGQPGGRQNVALLDPAPSDEGQGLRTHDDATPGHRLSRRLRLRPNLHHAGPTLLIEVGEMRPTIVAGGWGTCGRVGYGHAQGHVLLQDGLLPEHS